MLPDAPGRRDNVWAKQAGEEFMGGAAAGTRTAGRWIFAAALLALATPTQAAEIKVLSSNATRTLLEDIAPMFEKASGHKVTLGFGTSQQVAKRVEAGEAADLVVITPEAIDRLVKDNKVVA